MAGSHLQGVKARDTNLRNHGPDFYRRIGALGGSRGNHSAKGFAVNRDLASRVGRIGGRISRRPKRSSTN